MRAVLRIRKEPYYRRRAFEQGLQHVGFKIVDKLTPTEPSDWLILWNKKAGAEEKEADEWERRGGTVIVAENGYLSKIDKTYYAISVHGHNGSGWFPVGNEDRFSLLGFDVKPWRTGGAEMLVRAQRGIGSALMASPPMWAEKMVAKLKVRQNLPVRLISHPGNFAPKVSVEQNLKNASILHIWCSAMGVRALVEGVQVTYHAPHWVCAGTREEALQRMAWGQWHFDEIATGLPFARIIERRSEAVW